ncbi:ABC-2 type transport system ATP-binding protein [Spiroplasma clarkii]|uniref:ATP-binding cassette domain-containing protein n=1 Tax=Spiroplasma clarkii TaxID=2139 RepID=UPI000B557424|nr:ATP-binding cassette domain-containing protein [Spiroplasma clarkii]ARU92128.1 ABC-2 type transport system ATP-binding protein [Spiroplasma clarkii]
MITINNLSKVFKNGAGIKGINLEIKPGKIFTLLGPNGAGKSTLLKTIFNEYKADSGTVTYNNETKDFFKKFSFFTDQSLFPRGIGIYFFVYMVLNWLELTQKKLKKS